MVITIAQVLEFHVAELQDRRAGEWVTHHERVAGLEHHGVGVGDACHCNAKSIRLSSRIIKQMQTLMLFTHIILLENLPPIIYAWRFNSARVSVRESIFGQIDGYARRVVDLEVLTACTSSQQRRSSTDTIE